jgi:hypothetical protein
MSFITDHKQKFDDLRTYIDNRDKIRLKANGGNSILVSIPPDEESLYIAKAEKVFSEEASFIDVSKLFVKYIDKDGWDTFKNFYLDFRETSHKVFKSDDPSEDLFDMIITEIESVDKTGKIPFLVRTSCLYGTGIDNINITEHKIVMELKVPLVIFYPSSFENETLHFLNFKKASKYRCVLVK